MTVVLIGTSLADAAPRERRRLRRFFSPAPTGEAVSEPPVRVPERPYWSDTP